MGKSLVRIVAVVLLLGVLLLVACAPKGAATPAPAAPAPQPEERKVVPQVAATAKAAWEAEWEKVLEAGKKEGRVVVYGTFGAETRARLVRGFKDRYGMSLEVITAKGAEVSEKLFAERRAGLYLADLYIGGSTTIVTQIKPAGVLDPLEPALILPEVLDPKAWWRGNLDWVDRDRLILAFLGYPSAPLGINTDHVKPAEMKSYRDLLNPKWKGKISMNDPTVAGTGAKLVGVIGMQITGLDFMRELVKQEPFILRDQRLQVDWLARGKYPIAIQPKTDVMGEARRAGAPITDLTPEEGTYMSSGSGCMALINRAPHPNAAKVFINWLLSKEGQTIFTQAQMAQSGRVDVTTEHLDPVEVRVPGKKYFEAYSEDFTKLQPEHMKIAAEIFGPLMK